MKGTRETRFFGSSRKNLACGAQTRHRLTAWVAIFFFLVWAFSTHSHVGSFNDRSRMAAIESLVQRGTWVIDESPFSRTVDRIYVDGHFYSDKPPVLTFIASGVYAVLNKGFHLSLDAGWCDLDAGPCHCRAFCDDSPDWVYYLLTLTLVGLPSALMLALFYHVPGLFGLDNPAALLLTAALGLATQVFPYSTVFNSHIPAAACLLAGFYALLRAQKPGFWVDDLSAQTGKNPLSPRWLFVAGLLTALASTFDLGVGLFFVAFLGYAAWEALAKVGQQVSGQERPCPSGTTLLPRLFTNFTRMAKHLPWSYLLGGLLPVALMVFLNYQIVGGPLPPYMYTQGYDYPASRFPQTIAGNRSPENVLVYGLRLTFGDHGLFAFNPVLLWAVVALVQVWRDRPSTKSNHRAGRLRGAAVLIGLTSSLFVLYFIMFTDNFGGAAYGPRWYTVFIPPLFIFVAARWRNQRNQVFRKPSSKPGFWTSRLLFAALAAISLVNGYQGSLNPWREATPLLWLGYAQPGWREPVDAALSGVTFEEIEPDLLAAFATRRVDKRWFDARSCLVIPPGPMWLFVGPGTPLDPALAERIGLSSRGSVTCHVDLRPARDAYLERVTTSAWASPIPADFGGQLALLGYELLSDEVSAGTEVTLITAWRVEGKPEPPLAIFVHLVNPQGHIGGQFDGLGANPDGLRPGDVLLHVHRFTVAPDAPPGRYWLQLGLYNPDTMARLRLTGQDSDRLLLAQVEVTGR